MHTRTWKQRHKAVCTYLHRDRLFLLQSITEYNGGSVLAMAGKNCIAIASDKRLGSERLTTISSEYDKIDLISDRTCLACAGLATDCITLQKSLRFHANLFKIREERLFEAEAIATYVGKMLYKRRFSPWFVSPIVAGLSSKNEPVLYSFDLLGTPDISDSFAVGGTGSEMLMGVAENLWRPDMVLYTLICVARTYCLRDQIAWSRTAHFLQNPEELFETCSQILLAAMDRDCLSGWGGKVYIM